MYTPGAVRGVDNTGHRRVYAVKMIHVRQPCELGHEKSGWDTGCRRNTGGSGPLCRMVNLLTARVSAM